MGNQELHQAKILRWVGAYRRNWTTGGRDRAGDGVTLATCVGVGAPSTENLGQEGGTGPKEPIHGLQVPQEWMKHGCTASYPQQSLLLLRGVVLQVHGTQFGAGFSMPPSLKNLYALRSWNTFRQEKYMELKGGVTGTQNESR
ncbi:uncharacterized protein MEPE_06851 [Melanopsichium pennsylvanicum]|uniref:Uncharacterized protein n=1 Tax=Melanopsichium pennsylvanicum TaxID=63383 RepID=A0AAJ5C8L5_9BASI|nr:uncharacterized protein MEPE_06851 [Melanopsichium pennsylvanicum]